MLKLGSAITVNVEILYRHTDKSISRQNPTLVIFNFIGSSRNCVFNHSNSLPLIARINCTFPTMNVFK